MSKNIEFLVEEIKLLKKSHYNINDLEEKFKKELNTLLIQEKKSPDNQFIRNNIISNFTKITKSNDQNSSEIIINACIILKIINLISNNLNENKRTEYIIEIMKGGHVKIEDNGELFDQLKKNGIFARDGKDLNRDSSHYIEEKARADCKNFDELNDIEKKTEMNKARHKLSDYSLVSDKIFNEMLFVLKPGDKACTTIQFEGHSHHEPMLKPNIFNVIINKLLKAASFIPNIFNIHHFDNIERLAHSMDWIKYKITGKNVGQYGLSIHTDKNPIICDMSNTITSSAKTSIDLGKIIPSFPQNLDIKPDILR